MTAEVIYSEEIGCVERKIVHHVGALVRFYVNGSMPFEGTKEQTTETMPLALRTITAANNEDNYKLTRAATLLHCQPSNKLKKIPRK